MRLWLNRSGATMVEFALVLPILILLIFGALDIGWAVYQWNAASKATQLGARWAAVERPVSDALELALVDTSYIVPEDLGKNCSTTGVICQQLDFSCPGAGCNADRMSGLLSEMQRPFPWLRDGEFNVRYHAIPSDGAIGFVGRPGGTPMWVTVSIRCRHFEWFLIDGFLGWALPEQQENCTNGPGIPITASYTLSTEALARP